MNYKQNKSSFLLFLFSVLLIVVGGFIYVYIFINSPKEEEQDLVEEKIDYRIDKTKDYIIFSNEVVLLEDEEHPISNYDININLKDYDTLEKTLNNFDNKIEYEKNILKKFEYREYEIINYENFISLIVKTYLYETDINNALDINAYIFDKENGSLVSEEKLLEKYGKTSKQVKDKVEEKLKINQVVEDDEDLININDTLNPFQYILYISKIGDLKVEYIIKSTENDYYDNITLD
jgi:hypothetical protein